MFHRCRCFVIGSKLSPHELLTFEITLPRCSVRYCSAPVPIMEKTLRNPNSEIANIGSLNTIENCALNLHRFTEQLQNYLTSLFLYPGCICMYTARSTLRYTAVELTAFAARFVELISGLGVGTLTLIGRWDVASDWCCSWLRQSRPNPCRCSNLAQPNRRDQPGAALSVLASEIPAWIVSSLENREYGRRLKDSHSCQHRESCVWDGVGM